MVGGGFWEWIGSRFRSSAERRMGYGGFDIRRHDALVDEISCRISQNGPRLPISGRVQHVFSNCIILVALDWGPRRLV